MTETLVDCSVVDVLFKIQTEKTPNIFIGYKNTKPFSDVLWLLSKREKDPLVIILFLRLVQQFDSFLASLLLLEVFIIVLVYPQLT